jgi:hypothetical protein
MKHVELLSAEDAGGPEPLELFVVVAGHLA